MAYCSPAPGFIKAWVRPSVLTARPACSLPFRRDNSSEAQTRQTQSAWLLGPGGRESLPATTAIAWLVTPAPTASYLLFLPLHAAEPSWCYPARAEDHDGGRCTPALRPLQNVEVAALQCESSFLPCTRGGHNEAKSSVVSPLAIVVS